MSKRAKRADEVDFVPVCGNVSCTWLDDGQSKPMVICETCPAMACPMCGSHVSLWWFPKGNMDAVRTLLAKRASEWASLDAHCEEVRH